MTTLEEERVLLPTREEEEGLTLDEEVDEEVEELEKLRSWMRSLRDCREAVEWRRGGSPVAGRYRPTPLGSWVAVWDWRVLCMREVKS